MKVDLLVSKMTIFIVKKQEMLHIISYIFKGSLLINSRYLSYMYVSRNININGIVAIV